MRTTVLIDLPRGLARELVAEARRRADSPGRVVEDALRPFLVGLRAVRDDVERAGQEAAGSRGSQ